MFERNGHTVHLIDMPGFEQKHHPGRSLSREDMAAFLNKAYNSCGVQVSGIISLYRINNHIARAQGFG